jgi:hypothetical protein
VRHAARTQAPAPAGATVDRPDGPTPAEVPGLGNLGLQRALAAPTLLPPAALTAGGLLRAGNQAVARLLRGGDQGRPLESGLRGAMEARLGRRLDHVRIHDDQAAAASVRAAGALASAIGHHVAFDAGQYAPDSPAGRQLLVHELVHVIQQSRGGRPGPPSVAAESEADRVADLVLRTPDRVGVAATGPPSPMYQRKPARRPTSVSLVVISSGNMQIDFHTDAGVFSYALTECDVDPGDYSATVQVSGSGDDTEVRFVLREAPEGVRFRFSYKVAEGQANPATLFRRQRTVRVRAGVAGAQAGVGTTGGQGEQREPPAAETVPATVPPSSAQPEVTGIPTVTVSDLAELEKLRQRGLIEPAELDRIESSLEAGELVTFQEAMDLLDALGRITQTGTTEEQGQARQSWVKWARFVKQNQDKLTGGLAAGRGGRTVEEVDALIAKYGGYATVSAGREEQGGEYDLERAKSWNSLAQWEKDLWKELARAHPEMLIADASASKDLHLHSADLLGMALRLSPRYIKAGGREALEALFNDPLFWIGTFAGIILYIAAWTMPEPIISKATASGITIALLTVFTLGEIKNLVVAWMNLTDESRYARSLADVERAAEHFGKALGGTIARVLVMLAQLVAGKLLPAPKPPTGGGIGPTLEPALVEGVPGLEGAPAEATAAVAPVVAGRPAVGAVGPTTHAMTGGPEQGGGKGAEQPEGGREPPGEAEPAKPAAEEAPVDYGKLTDEQLKARALQDPRAAQELVTREAGRTGGEQTIRAPTEPAQRSAELAAETPPVETEAARLLKPADIQPGMELDPTQAQVFRGGKDLTLKPGETRIDKPTGLVKTTHGPSLDVNPSNVQRFGGAYRIRSIPPELKIIQRGRIEHFEIVPRKPMTLDEFQRLLNLIELY